MYTYINKFHNSSAKCKYSEKQIEDAIYAVECGTQRQAGDSHLILAAAKRLKRKLCGNSGCRCSAFSEQVK